ncbi:E3 ubiquitin-protein ligase TRIM39-like isoform X1 [Clarias magur]|uniref:E3 ubiquitin-protein ligase TRIM39-like isoform X1 n=2 Tax=Clarias magur TaxID=1594786 RepID=A0A8J4X7E5_CLAMG|nr:E3 ubiquitin-protein ligase TRIM39-like isoform X1 [Clarias magur]
MMDVTLDPNTANPFLILSDCGKQVTCGDKRQNLPDNQKRFDHCVSVLGKEGLSSRRFYYEVQVRGKNDWNLGVIRASANRMGEITACPENGYWCLSLKNGNEFSACDSPHVLLAMKQAPQRVGVYVDYKEGRVSFYEVNAKSHIYSFTELKKIQEHAVDVTLDPDTANPCLALTNDGKEVTCENFIKRLPDNPERFDRCVSVLGKEGFSSGRFYYEVHADGKTEWDIGVVRESVNRKGKIIACPENGFWCVSLDSQAGCVALDSPFIPLSLKPATQKVGVFVDYEEGLVSFYDVDAMYHIYSFTVCFMYVCRGGVDDFHELNIVPPQR